MSEMTFKLTCDEVSGYDTTSFAIDDNYLYKFCPGVQFNVLFIHLAHECLVCPKQQLLAGLAAGIESTAYLCPTERTVGKIPAILTGKGDPLCHALVDNVVAYLGKAINVPFPGAVVSSFYGVVKKPVNRIAIVGVVLCGIDTTLCSNGVCTARRILDSKAFHFKAHLCQRSGC